MGAQCSNDSESESGSSETEDDEDGVLPSAQYLSHAVENHKSGRRTRGLTTRPVVLSVRFDKHFKGRAKVGGDGIIRTKKNLGVKPWPAATVQLLGGEAKVYNPNKFAKEGKCKDDSCSFNGNKCEFKNFRDGKPTLKSCWRPSYRWHLEEAHKMNGKMVQIVEEELGPGQEIECQLAAEVGIPVVEVNVPANCYMEGVDDESEVLSQVVYKEVWKDVIEKALRDARLI